MEPNVNDVLDQVVEAIDPDYDLIKEDGHLNVNHQADVWWDDASRRYLILSDYKARAYASWTGDPDLDYKPILEDIYEVLRD